MDSYFFIPADQLNKLSKISLLNADYFIADLEDAVVKNNYDVSIHNLLNLGEDRDFDFVRIDPYLLREDAIHDRLFSTFRGVLYPKISNLDDLIRFKEFAQRYKTRNILLIEHPYALMNLNELVANREEYSIVGMAFGNHDYASSLGVSLDSGVVNFARLQTLTLAKAYNLLSIDIASMELTNKEKFVDECTQGFSWGFDGKFIIHPRQLDWLKGIRFYSSDEVKWARSIVNKLGPNKDDFTPFVYNGQVVEIPHLLKARKILKHE